MNDREINILSKYDFEVLKSGRTKGASLLETTKGLYLLKEFKGTIKHLEFEENLLNKINSYGIIGVDNIIRNIEGNLINEGDDGEKYVLRRWYDARDCEVKNELHLLEASKALANLHEIMNHIIYSDSFFNACCEKTSIMEQLKDEYIKHNRELKRTRNFIRNLNRKSEFELLILESFDEFYKDAYIVETECCKAEFTKFINDSLAQSRIVHGAYNYHNIMIGKDICIIINFDHAKCGIQIRDLYDFLRKVMEKHNWNYELGHQLLDVYNKIKPISASELNYLRLRLEYPEKYWKILNHYTNNNKSWIPDKDVEKLKSVIQQNKFKTSFVNSL